MQISNPVQDGMKSRVRKGDLRFSGTSVPCHDKSKIVLPQKTNSSLNHKSRTQIKWSNANDTWLPPLSCDRSQDQVCAHGGSAVAHTTARSARFGQVSTSLLRGGFALNIFTPLDTTRHRHTRHAHNKNIHRQKLQHTCRTWIFPATEVQLLVFWRALVTITHRGHVALGDAERQSNSINPL